MYVNALDKQEVGLHLYFLEEDDKQEGNERLERWLTPAHAMTDNAESSLYEDPFRWRHHDEGCWCKAPNILQSLKVDPTASLDM